MQFRIGKEWYGKQILTYLTKEVGLSSGHIRSIKTVENGITLQGMHATVRDRFGFIPRRDGDTKPIPSPLDEQILELALEDRAICRNVVPRDLPIEIIFEDERLLVVNKPAGMPTHPSHGHFDDTLANAVFFRYHNRPFTFRPVNRLDRNTGGILLVAKDRLTANTLSTALADGKFGKTYIAVTNGVPSSDSPFVTFADGWYTLNCPIKRMEDSTVKREICGFDEPDAEQSVTRFRILDTQNGKALLEVCPLTGRTHQIRVHLSAIGCALEGDDLYGVSSPAIPRHALQAVRLSFPDPITAEILTFRAPIAQDMAELITTYFPTFRKEEIE